MIITIFKETLPFPSELFLSQCSKGFPFSCTMLEARQPIQLGPHREQSRQAVLCSARKQKNIVNHAFNNNRKKMEQE